jgi:hypothetical protein
MTLTQLKTRVLERLMVLAAGETPNADDAQLVERRYREVHDMLLVNDLASWAVEEDIPDNCATAMRMIVAYYCAPEFGITGQFKGELAIEGALDASPVSLGERMLRKQQATSYTNEPSQPDYF